MKKILLSAVLFFLASFCFVDTIASGTTLTSNNFQPAVLGQITGGAGFKGHADVLLPLKANNKKLIYTDLTASLDNHSAFAVGPGLGLRDEKTNHIEGVYLFGEYSNTANNAAFFTVNPGIEWMSLHWDFHINGYFPINKRATIHSLGYPSDRGDESFTTFSGRTQYDQEQILYDFIGEGTDAILGYTLPIHDLKGRVYGGGYHYAANKVKARTGFEAGFEYPINHFISAIAEVSSDNIRHESIGFTLRYRGGSISNELQSDISERMTEVAQRHLGTFYTGSNLPTQRLSVVNGAIKVYRDNIFFFQPIAATDNLTSPQIATIGQNECTLSHPCTFNQNMIDAINNTYPDNAILYLAPGSYSPAAGTTAINVYRGQSIYGRSSDYQTASQQSTVRNPMTLVGTNTIDSLRFNINSATSISAITANSSATGTINLSNLNIDMNSQAAATALTLNGSNTVNIANMTVNVTAADATVGVGAAGIRVNSTNTLTINDSLFNVTNTLANGTARAIDIVSTGTNSTNLTLNNSTLNINSTSGSNFGIRDVDQSQVVANNVTITGTQTQSGGGVAAVLVTNNAMLALNNSSITTTGAGTAGAAGIALSINGSANINNTTFNLAVTGNGYINVINSSSAGTVNVNNGTYNLLDTSSGNDNGIVAFREVGSGILNVNNATVTARRTGTGTGGSVMGTLADTGTINIANSSFDLTNTAGVVIGAYGFGSAGKINLNNVNFANLFSQTGQVLGLSANASTTITSINSSYSIFGDNTSAVQSGAGTITRTGGSCSVNGAPC